MKAQRGIRRIDLLFLTSELDGCVWSTPSPGLFTPGKETRNPLYRRLSRPKVRPGRVRQISAPPPPGIRSPDPPASSELLYRLRYYVWTQSDPVTGPVWPRGLVEVEVTLLFHDRGTRRGPVVSSTLRPHFTPGKDTVPILQEAGWAPGPVWTGGKSRPHRDSIPDHPARSQSLYRLSYPLRCHGPWISTRTSHISWPFWLKVGEIFT